jgi:GDP-mannose 6-dehydrogenase
MTTVSVFGLGYVGSVLTACLADNGYRVIGVDANPAKVALVAQGSSPIREKKVGELLERAVGKGLVQATTDAYQATRDSDISLVCVGTPSNGNGMPNLTYIRKVSEEIGAALKTKLGYHVIAVRSTVPPGTTESVIVPLLEKSSGKKAGRDFGVCFNPEFLREGSSVADFYDPPFTVIGTDNDQASAALSDLYGMVAAPVMIVPFKVAEMLKYVNNAFHALKVSFANEVGNICRSLGVDSHQVMDLFCADKKLNLSSYYLKPGFAFGGSCLPKDLRGLVHLSRHMDLSVPILEAILPSNRRQVEIACSMVEEAGYGRVGICGFAFKPGTDDLRESPMVGLIEYLVGKGRAVKVYDEHVSLDQLHGANRAYIEQAVPHIARLMVESLDEVVRNSDVIVLGAQTEGVRAALEHVRRDQVVIDLVRVPCNTTSLNGNYRGICW